MRSLYIKDSFDGASINGRYGTQFRVNNLRIQIAEDNTVNRKVLCRILDGLNVTNYEIVENGRLDMDRQTAKEIDIVLNDMQTPVMDGIEACRLIRSRPASD